MLDFSELFVILQQKLNKPKMKRPLLSLLLVSLFCSCAHVDSEEDKLNITKKFNTTWNIYEKIVQNDDGTITYQALPWGGLVGIVKENNMSVDWSGYESITFDFAEPTKVPTQIMVSDALKTWGKPGITSLTCYFDGHNMKSVDEIALQAGDTATLVVRGVRLTPTEGTWEQTNLWDGYCIMGNWQDGFVVTADQFSDVSEGDKLEFLFTTDRSNPEVKYWLLKTIFNGTDQTLEGNSTELNEWGCATMSANASSYRIVLTENDAARLHSNGLFVNGYYNTITQCNLLRKHYDEADEYAEVVE